MGTSFRGRFGRRTAMLAAAGLLFGLAPNVAASAATGDPSDLVEGCSEAPSSSGRFKDYGTLSVRERTIVDCLSNGYVGANGPTDYVLKGTNRPDGTHVDFNGTITRAQFASILNRLGDYLGIPAQSGDSNNPTFADVPAHNVFFGDIEELAKRGLTQGRGSDVDDVDGDGDTQESIYDPAGTVSYAQVLTFIKRLADRAGMPLPSGQSHNEFTSDCGVFNGDRDALDQAGYIRSFNSPNNCSGPAIRSNVFDLAAVGLDLGVEQDFVASPFFTPSGTMAMSIDHTSRFTDEFSIVTVTVLDPEEKPVVDQRVDVFLVKTDAGFNADGSPTKDPFLVVDSGNRSGTGDTAGTIDGNDRMTDSNGQVRVTVGTGATATASYDLYAFIGDIGDDWADVKDTEGEAVSGTKVTFSRLPTQLVVTMNTSSTGNLPYGKFHNVTYQLLDADNAPVQVAGLSILTRIDRNPSVGSDELFMYNLATNENGEVTLANQTAQDPDTQTAGHSTVDTFSGTWDRNRDGVVNGEDTVATTTNGQVTFLDRPAREVIAAVIELPNSNSNVKDQTGALINVTNAKVTVKVTNIYGAAVPNIGVQFRRGVVQTGAFPLVAFTNEFGIAAIEYQRTTTTDDEMTAWVDRDEDGNYFELTDDFQASSYKGGNDRDVTVHWVNPPPMQVAGTTNTYSSQAVVGYTVDYLYLDGAAVRLPFDTGGVVDLYKVNNEGVSRAQFFAALQADEAQDDTVTVTYDADHISTWNLTVVGGGATPVPVN